MSVRKELGKITAASFGFGGYQDVQFGVSFMLGTDGWGVHDFWGTWAEPPSKYAKWTLEDQDKIFAETSRKIIQLLRDAKVDDVSKLKGVPVEVTFENERLQGWRVLKEVL